MHIRDNICIISFQEDLQYWGINESDLNKCCLHKYYYKKEEVLENMQKDSEYLTNETTEKFKGYFPNIRRKIWNLVEHPYSSKTSYVRKLLVRFK